MKSINLKDANLNDFRVFYYAAKELNYSKAANILGVTQPTISIVIKKIESEYDCKLIESNKKNIKLTPEGEKVFYYVESLFESLNENFNKLLSGSGDAVETLNIGIPTYLGTHFLTKILPQLTGNNSKINIIAKPTMEMVKLLHDGSIDILIDEDLNYFTNSNIVIDNLVSIDSCFAASKDFNDMLKKENTVSEILNNNLLLPSDNSNARKLLNNNINAFDSYEARMTISNNEMMINLAKQGLGIGYFKRISILNELYSKDLFEIPITFSLPKTNIQIAYNKHNLKGIVANFVDNLKTYVDRLKLISNKTLRICLDKPQDDFSDMFFAVQTLNKFYDVSKIHFVINSDINYDNFISFVENLKKLKFFIVITINNNDLIKIESVFKYLNRLNIYLDNKDTFTFPFPRRQDLYVKFKYDIIDNYDIDTDNINKLIVIANNEGADIKLNFSHGKKDLISKYTDYVKSLGYELEKKEFNKITYIKETQRIMFSIDDCEACTNGLQCYNNNNLHLTQDGYLSICKVACTSNYIKKEITSRNEYELDRKIDKIIFDMKENCYKKGKF